MSIDEIKYRLSSYDAVDILDLMDMDTIDLIEALHEQIEEKQFELAKQLQD